MGNVYTYGSKRYRVTIHVLESGLNDLLNRMIGGNGGAYLMMEFHPGISISLERTTSHSIQSSGQL